MKESKKLYQPARQQQQQQNKQTNKQTNTPTNKQTNKQNQPDPRYVVGKSNTLKEKQHKTKQKGKKENLTHL